MSGLVSEKRWNRMITVPVALPQTELRREQDFIVGKVKLNYGERFEIRFLWISLVGFIYYSALPENTGALTGLCSVGVYYENMGTSPLMEVAACGAGVYGAGLFNPCVVETPGIYVIGVRNHLRHSDVMVAVSGAGRLYW